MEKKITKRSAFEQVQSILMDAMSADVIDNDTCNTLVAFFDNEIELLNKRAAKAKTSKPKAENDILTTLAIAVMGTDTMTIPEIVNAINADNPDVDATPQKMVYRLDKLVKTGIVECGSTTIKADGKSARKVNTYKVIAHNEEDGEE